MIGAMRPSSQRTLFLVARAAHARSLTRLEFRVDLSRYTAHPIPLGTAAGPTASAPGAMASCTPRAWAPCA